MAPELPPGPLFCVGAGRCVRVVPVCSSGVRCWVSVRMSDDRIDDARDEQEHEDFGEAQADRPPTEDEERLAEEAARGVDVGKVAEHYEDMAERGAQQKGEGRID